MKAVAYQQAGSIDQDDVLQDITLDKPVAQGRDLLVRVEAVSVNPVDTKLRRNLQPEGWKVLGYDAAGVVESVGDLVTNFKPGDDVFYAGTINRQGTNSEYHLVDERIVGYKPTSLNYPQAAALPLTAITAWEMLFDRLKIKQPVAQGSNSILIVGAAGGVGSIAVQLVRALTDMTIIATASRPETQDWVRQCGAHHIMDHRKPLAPQLQTLGIDAPGFVFSTTHTDSHFSDIVELIAPQGRFGLIDEIGDNSVAPLKNKSVSLHWEFMFTRSVFDTPDLTEQSRLLNEVARLVDAGQIQSTATQVAGRINAETLRKVHALIESGTARGKIVLEGFE